MELTKKTKTEPQSRLFVLVIGGRSVEKHRNKLLVTLRRLMNASIQRLCSLGALLPIKDWSGVLTATPTKRKEYQAVLFLFGRSDVSRLEPHLKSAINPCAIRAYGVF